MRTLILFGSLAILNMIRCAVVTLSVNKMTLMNMPTVMLHLIASYSGNPFLSYGLLNHYFRQVMTTFPLKQYINEVFNILELADDDLEYNEQGFKYLLPYTKFSKNPIFVFQALRNEFMNGDKYKLNILIPQLIAYFDRYKGTERDDCWTLIKRKRYDILLQNDASRFIRYVERIFVNQESTQTFQEFILANPQYFDRVKGYFE